MWRHGNISVSCLWSNPFIQNTALIPTPKGVVVMDVVVFPPNSSDRSRYKQYGHLKPPEGRLASVYWDDCYCQSPGNNPLLHSIDWLWHWGRAGSLWSNVVLRSVNVHLVNQGKRSFQRPFAFLSNHSQMQICLWCLWWNWYDRSPNLPVSCILLLHCRLEGSLLGQWYVIWGTFFIFSWFAKIHHDYICGCDEKCWMFAFVVEETHRSNVCCFGVWNWKGELALKVVVNMPVAVGYIHLYSDTQQLPVGS